MSDGRLVWDSDSGSVDDGDPRTNKPPLGDGVVRIRRETGSRGGKTVTTITGIPADAKTITTLSKQLKRLCGVGGSVKDFVIEIQGDQRERVVAFLEERGYVVKLAGG